MLDHGERDERLEHRDFDLLPQAGALAGEKRRHDRIGAGQPRNLVGDDRAQIGRLAPGEPGLKIDPPRRRLDDVVIGGKVPLGAWPPETVKIGVADSRIWGFDARLDPPERPYGPGASRDRTRGV